MRYLLILFWAGLWSALPASGQSSTPDDSLALQAAIEAVYPLEAADPDRAVALYDSLQAACVAKAYWVGAGRAAQYAGIVESDRGKYDQALHHYRQAIPHFEAAHFPTGLASTQNNMGVQFTLQGRWDSAAVHYVRAIERYEALADTNALVILYGNTSAVFKELGRYPKALRYAETGLQLAQAFGDSLRLADALINLATVQPQVGQSEQAAQNGHQALRIGEALHDPFVQYLAHNILADLAQARHQPMQALQHARQARQYADAFGDPFHRVTALKNLGASLFENQRTDSARVYLQQAARLAAQIHAWDKLAETHLLLSDVTARRHDYATALQHLHAYRHLHDSLENARTQRLVTELEARYQSEQKDRRLAEQQLAVAQAQSRVARQRALNGWLVGGLLFLLSVGALLYRTFRQRAALKDQTIAALEKQQEVERLRALLEGEEKERQRLARELHDGIGGQMALLQAKARGKQDVAQLADEIRDANQEIRRIAHNLTPGILQRHGFCKAVETFVEEMNAALVTPQVVWQCFGPEARMPPHVALPLYRIVQELVYNARKHAGARQLLVQLNIGDEALDLTVEDDGNGQLPQAKAKGRGIGWSNIEQRVASLGATLHIEATPGQGSTVTLQVPISALQHG
ncbi:Histidine kinase [Catalinimonas alkaloidigena]|uniref:Oxygen sensor histidine kinase NreB n=1 Tax=Catalinimonas alkaloidigena TaxID=1075417 RepID=A0A1G9PE00_9BACT|nr:tetratricopeptide repeat protein [Catalinimonas alkaloidigena]SDL96988.1 Histidine kinase [Catalinimonas alkaloidigena]